MSEALVQVNPDAVREEVAPIVGAAFSLTVTNIDEHTHGLKLLTEIMNVRDRVKRIFKPMVDATMESKRKAELARQEAVALQDSVLAPVLEAYDIAEKKCAAFEMEERKAAKANQEAINKEALAKQEEQRLMDAAMADTPEQAEAALTTALPPPLVPVVLPGVAKVAGVSTRVTWTAEVTDLKAFYRWCLDTDNIYLAGEPNMVALNGRARAEHDKLAIPGVKAVENFSHARR